MDDPRVPKAMSGELTEAFRVKRKQDYESREEQATNRMLAYATIKELAKSGFDIKDDSAVRLELGGTG